MSEGSTRVAGMSYNADRAILRITYRDGRTLEWKDVSVDKIDELLAARPTANAAESSMTSRLGQPVVRRP